MEILITVLVVLEILLLAAAFRIWATSSGIKKELKQILEDAKDRPQKIYSPRVIEKLPPPLQRYFDYCLTPGQQVPSIALVRQSGFIKTRESSSWLPVSAVQYFDGRDPAFIWIARVSTSLGGWLSARDMYHRGKGNMLIRWLSIFTVTSAQGKEMDISSLIRYVSELTFCPTALIFSANINWEAIGRDRVRASITDGSHIAGIEFDINKQGQIIRACTVDRYRQGNGRWGKQEWIGTYSNYCQFNGMMIPTDIKAEWKSGQKSFNYVKLHLDSIKFA
ncbi:MAG: DUF6544 family protein [Actinomycetota bacterium]|nr:DUF6544 family protein [Actinomycetota bacterium]